jgi:basic amino acid/polyamine antiporter, APA family
VTGMLQACTYVFFAFIGFESIANMAQEAEKPSRSLPRATIGALVISFVLYIGICVVMIGLLPYQLFDQNNALVEAM